MVTGLILQLATGNVDAAFFWYPVNLLFGGAYLVLLLLLHLLSRRSAALRWFAGLEASITSLCIWLVLVVLMGLTPQVAPTEHPAGGLIARLGVNRMTTSWPFVLLFLYVLTVLGQVTLRKLARFRWKDIPFVLNHAGLFITLWAAILGNGDLQRLRMPVSEGAAEWRATDETGGMTELSLAIELKNFTIDEYPPKLMIIDNTTGKAQPEGQPVNLLVEESPLSGSLLDWTVEVTDYLPMAACVADKDTVNFVGFQSEGATSALYVKALNRKDGSRREGWVSSGNYMFPYVTLPLSDSEILVMPEREPRRFASDVTVYTKDKQKKEALIEVNKPFSVAGGRFTSSVTTRQWANGVKPASSNWCAILGCRLSMPESA